MTRTVLSVEVLGPLRVTVDGAPADVGGARLRALLVRLALDAGHAVAPGALADDLWGPDLPADPANAVQTLVSRLRRALGGAATVTSGPAGYRLDVAPDAVDALRFTRLVAAARGDAMALRAALALWRGPALADVDAPFADAAAQRLDRARLLALEDALDADVRAGRGAAVLAEAEALADAEPLRERAQAVRLRALAASGRTADALTGYAEVRERLADTLGVDPSPDLQALHLDLLHADGTPPAPRRPLPVALTAFVGREADVDAVDAALAGRRLVTLLGPGGAGKTRLATEVGRRLAAAGTDVRLVELAPQGADGVLAAVADALGLRDRNLVEGSGPAGTRPAGPVLERLADAVGGHAMVLVLDNCEHVVEVAADVADRLLARCPGLRVLATSREPLRISGEALHPLGPLAVPAPGATPAEAAAFPAVALLVDRAAAVRPGFVLDGATVGPVVEICRRLDGLPLAIELAAARLRTLPPDAVAARLDDRFGLLTGGSRTALPRHRTLRAVVAWSWDLLDPAERAVAARAGVFAGSFGEDAAAAVCADVAGADVPDVLLALADKSILHAGEADGAVRYRMLETIREYAVERLVEDGLLAAARDRHADHFLHLVETAEPLLRTADQLRWLAVLTRENANVLAALRWLVAEGDAERAVRLAAGMAWFWTLRGRHAEATTWAEAVLALPGDAPDGARLVLEVAHAISASGATSLPPDRERLLAAARRHSAEHPLLVMVEPGALAVEGDFAGANRVLERLVAADQPPWTRAMLHLMGGLLAENEGEVAREIEQMTLALQGFRAVGDRWGTATALMALSVVLPYEGRVDEALALTREAAECARAIGAADDLASLGLRAVLLRARLGEDPAALLAELDRVVAAFDAQVSGHSEAFALMARADLLRRGGDLDAAHAAAVAALAAVEPSVAAPPQIESVIRAGLAWIEAALGRVEDAAHRLRSPQVAAAAGFDMPVAATVAVAAAGVAVAAGDPHRAALLLGVADALRGARDRSDPDAADVAARLADALGADAAGAAIAAGRSLDRGSARALLAEVVGSTP